MEAGRRLQRPALGGKRRGNRRARYRAAPSVVECVAASIECGCSGSGIVRTGSSGFGLLQVVGQPIRLTSGETEISIVTQSISFMEH